MHSGRHLSREISPVTSISITQQKERHRGDAALFAYAHTPKHLQGQLNTNTIILLVITTFLHNEHQLWRFLCIFVAKIGKEYNQHHLWLCW